MGFPRVVGMVIHCYGVVEKRCVGVGGCSPMLMILLETIHAGVGLFYEVFCV